jgi:hypothetical protein
MNEVQVPDQTLRGALDELTAKIPGAARAACYPRELQLVAVILK